jgi:hypothetical protein
LTADKEKAKSIPSFLELVKLDEPGLKKRGIRKEANREKLMEAVEAWLEKYRFPGAISLLSAI